MHSVAGVVAEPLAGETKAMSVDADALRAESDDAVQAAYALGKQHQGPHVAEEEDALLMLVEEETPAVEAEVRRLQQLCNAQEAELTDRKVTEAESSRRLEEACKMLEHYESAVQALEDTRARLEDDLRAAEEQRMALQETAQAERDSLVDDLDTTTAALRAKEDECHNMAKQMRVQTESLSQAQLSAEKLKLELRGALAAAVEADKNRGLAQERALKDRTVWSSVLTALSRRTAQTRGQKLFKIVFSCMLLSQALLASHDLAGPADSEDEQIEHLATRVLEVKNQISRHHPPFSTSQPTSASPQEVLRGRHIRRD